MVTLYYALYITVSSINEKELKKKEVMLKCTLY